MIDLNVDWLISKIKEASVFPYFIFISGGSCSGKTYLAKLLKEFLNDESVVVEMDDCFKNKNDNSLPIISGYRSFDMPSSYHIEEMKGYIKKLSVEKEVMFPDYDIRTNMRVGTKAIVSQKYIIVEGLYASMISEAIGNLEQKVNIFMSASSKTRLERRIKRDVEEFGMNEKIIKKNFYDQVEIAQKLCIEKQKFDIKIETD